MTNRSPFDDAFTWSVPGEEPEPASQPAPRGPSRSEQATRRARRRRQERRKRLLTIGVGSVLGALLVLVVTDTVRFPASRPTLAARGATNQEPDGAANVPARPLTATTPMRLWIAGDSLAYATGQALGKLTATTGVVKPAYDARVSSGLNSPSFFDWPNHAKKELARLNPESVVFIIGANDVGIVGGSDWKPGYTEKVDTMMTLLAGTDGARHVYWIGPPTFRDKNRNAAAQQLGELMRERAQRNGHVTYIDAYKVFSDSKGKYQDKLPNDDGKLELVRTDDGVHFTAAGGTRLARAVFTKLDDDWDIADQAVVGSVQVIEETDGCCRTPSGSNSQWQTGPPPTRASGVTTTKAPASTTTTKSATTTSTVTASTAAPTSTTAPAATTPTTG